MINTTLAKKLQQAVAAQAQLNSITNDAEMCQNVQRVAELAAALMCRLATANGYSLSGQPTNMRYLTWNIDLPANGDTSNPMITINWENFWNYGGRDGGTFSFPLAYLTDDGQLLEYIKTSEIEIRRVENERAERALQQKIEQHQRLQKEISAARAVKSSTSVSTTAA